MPCKSKSKLPTALAGLVGKMMTKKAPQAPKMRRGKKKPAWLA